MLSGSQAEQHVLTLLKTALGRAQHVRGLFQGINESSTHAEVLDLETNTVMRLPYDFLVVASGRGYPSPIRPPSSSWKYPDRRRELFEYGNSLNQANTILVRGGGLVGVEMAAELVHRYSKKSVVLITRSPLLATLPRLAGKLAEEWLERKGVRVVVDEVEQREDSRQGTQTKVVTTKRGVELSYDLVIDCTGPPPSDGSTVAPYDTAGYVTVNPYLQVNIVL